MGLFSRLFGKEERAALDISTAAATNDGTEESTAAAALLAAIVGTGAIDADTAMEIPALSAAVDFVSGIVARLPVKLYREETDGSECRTNEITDDPRLRLLNEETGDLVSAYAARAAQISDMYRYGAGYVYINRSGVDIQSLHYVRYADVSVSKNADPIFKDAQIYVGGRSYHPWDFIILARKSEDGVRGKSIIDEHKTLLSSMYNTLKYENASSRTGGNKKGFLQSEKNLGKEALAAVRKAWEELYANNGNNMMVLNNGLKYTPSASTAVEMQLNQNKLTNTSQLDLAFLLSPEVISGKVSRDQFSLAMTNAVMPIVTLYQEAINRSLLLESEKRSMYFALDVNELLRGDTLTRYQAYAVGLQNNFLQLDEVRYKEDLPATGFNYITLGLNNVLLDPKTNVIYTPNTNQMVKVGDLVPNEGQKADEGLQSGENGGIIEERKAVFGKGHKIVDNVADGGGGGIAQLDNSTESGIIKAEVEIGRSVGAAAKNYPVKLLDSKQRVKLAEGQKIEGKVFAGNGTKTEIRDRFRLESIYKISADKWQKASGNGIIVVKGRQRKAELHWYQADGEIVEMKVKRYLDES